MVFLTCYLLPPCSSSPSSFFFSQLLFSYHLPRRNSQGMMDKIFLIISQNESFICYSKIWETITLNNSSDKLFKEYQHFNHFLKFYRNNFMRKILENKICFTLWKSTKNTNISHGSCQVLLEQFFLERRDELLKHIQHAQQSTQ